MVEENLESLSALDFKQFREKMDIDIAVITNPVDQAHLCRAIAGLYKHLSSIDKIDEIRLRLYATEEAKHFMQKSIDYTKEALASS